MEACLLRMTTLLRAAVTAAAVTGGVALAGPATASAASGCSGAGPTVKDYRGVSYTTRYCYNYRAGATRLGDDVGNFFTSGYLYAGRNWFVCQKRIGENPPVGSARNNIWLYTEGDVAYVKPYKGWGWFPATYVSGGTNYGKIPGLRTC